MLVDHDHDHDPGPGTAAPHTRETVRALATAGGLATAAADPRERQAIYAVVFDLTWPLVWSRHTRRLEAGKGHRRCASAVDKLAPECIDGFVDDVEAVVEYVLRFAATPIHTLEGWISRRITAATVDGHRRRRGERGALQRVRIPRWLAAALSDDPWSVLLAFRILEWAGIPATAGTELWPFDAWADLRAGTVGGHRSPETVATDVERVLAVMRARRPEWYGRYVERPLGRKPLPVAWVDQVEDRQARGGPELQETRLTELAAAAVDAIGAGLAEGHDPSELVPAVLRAHFLDDGSGVATTLDRAPGHGEDDRDRWLAAELDEDHSVARIVTAVLTEMQRPDWQPASGRGVA